MNCRMPPSRSSASTYRRRRSPLSFCPTFTLAGAYRTPDDADTAFGGSRSAGYVFNIEAAASDRETYEADRIVGTQLLGRHAAARDGLGRLRRARKYCATSTNRTAAYAAAKPAEDRLSSASFAFAAITATANIWTRVRPRSITSSGIKARRKDGVASPGAPNQQKERRESHQAFH